MTVNLIISNQRTGGTALLDFLSEFVSIVYHEPFNKNRQWYEEVLFFNNNKYFSEELLPKFSNSSSIIKHCIENSSDEFNTAFLQCSIEIGVPILFLFRRNETDRIESLKKALNTGKWFFNQKKSGYKKDISKINFKELSERVRNINENCLKETRLYPNKMVVYYEDLFDNNKTTSILFDVFNLFGIERQIDAKLVNNLLNFKTSDKNINILNQYK